MVMLTRINSFIIGISVSWWKFLLVFIAFNSTLFGLQNITASFPDISGGHQPFDMQNDLQSYQIFEQLSTYTDQAFSAYSLFQAIDYFFPLFGGLVIAAIAAFSLRHLSTKYYEIAVSKNLFLLMFIPTICDWLENLTLLSVIVAWPEEAGTLAALAVAAKKAKLVTLLIAQPITLLLLLSAALRWAGQKIGLLKGG
jgi:hypothetical protein